MDISDVVVTQFEINTQNDKQMMTSGQSLAILSAQLDLQENVHFESQADVINRFQKWNIILENMEQRVHSKYKH